MATGAIARGRATVRESIFFWEGRDKAGRVVKGEMRMDIETGTSLNQAFRKYPIYFDPLFCNLVAAGEQAGILETLLDRLAEYKEKTLALKGKIKKAMFYPLMIILVAILITAVIM